jgi:hypothetical protein
MDHVSPALSGARQPFLNLNRMFSTARHTAAASGDMPMKALIVSGHSQYGALHSFVCAAARALQARGCAASVIDTRAPDTGIMRVGEMIAAQRPADFVLTFQMFGEYRGHDGRTIGEIAGAPHVIQYVDHPLTHAVQLIDTPREAALLLLDRSHVAAVDDVLGPGRYAHLGFSPAAALGEAAPPARDAEDFVRTRPIAMLFTGTLAPPGDPPWLKMPEHVRPIFEAAAEQALANEFLPAHRAVDNRLRACGLDPDDAALREDLRLIRMLSNGVHEWVRNTRRWDFFAAADRARLPITAYGAWSGETARRFANIDYRGPVDFDATIALMRRARLTLNLNANFGDGAHDRTFTAMLAGSGVASDYSTYYAEEFAEGREIALFRWRDLDGGMARLRDLAQDHAALFAVAAAGQTRTAARHRWENRVDAILAAAEAARTRMEKAA